MMDATYTFWQLLTQYPIRIPLIQRDYAQGRIDDNIRQIRSKLVQALHEALTERRPLRLDFVYGSLPDGNFVPLDGQQRLTTLFLLHWYLAAQSQQLGTAREYLAKFSYQTRSSSRAFCRELARWEPGAGQLDGQLAVSKHIQDTHWFQPAWRYDPTVQGMLVMLDELEGQFGGTTGLFEQLQATDCPVDFYFLNMQEVGLTDDLYLKMNARGKPLTRFENWKAAFDLFLQQHHSPARHQQFGERMDNKWLDFLWPYRHQETALTDEAGENLLGYLTRMLAYGLEVDDKLLRPANNAFKLPFSLFEAVYRPETQVAFLFGALDFLAGLGKASGGADSWLGELLTEQPQLGKVVLFGTQPNLVRQVLTRANPSLQTQVLLLAVIAYGVARGGRELVPDDLRDLLRVVRNLLERERQQNDTKINSNLRYERLPTLVPAVRALAQAVAEQGDTYAVLATQGERLLSGLNASVVRHEVQKASLLHQQASQKAALQQLEDMPVLRGDLHNLPLAAPAIDLAGVAQAIAELWLGQVAQEDIIGAWLTQGDYSVYGGGTGWGGKWFLGSQPDWYTVLAADSGEVAATLPEFLVAYQRTPGTTPEERLAVLRQQRLAQLPGQVERDWRYYFITYPDMTAGSRAYYAWGDESGFELHLLRGNNLKAEHLDPYVRTVLRRGKLRGLVAGEAESWVNDKYLTPLRVLAPALPTDVAGPALYGRSEGWLLELAVGCRLPPELETRYDLQPDGEGRRWLRTTDTHDRIERVEDFVLALQQYGLEYEPARVEEAQEAVS